MNTDNDYRVNDELFSEVLTVFRSEQFLSGSLVLPSKFHIDTGKRIVTGELCQVDEFFSSISINNEHTPYTTLENDIIDYVQQCYNSLGSYFPDAYIRKIDEHIENLVKFTDASENVIKFIDYLASVFPNISGDISQSLKSHVISSVSRHIASLIQIRALTQSKNYAPTELILMAYGFGLYPFGWTYQKGISLLCINPYHQV